MWVLSHKAKKNDSISYCRYHNSKTFRYEIYHSSFRINVLTVEEVGVTIPRIMESLILTNSHVTILNFWNMQLFKSFESTCITNTISEC